MCFPELPIEHEVDSQSAARLAKQWIAACVDKHECVAQDGENGWIPTRLLDLGRKADPLSVRLITRKTSRQLTDVTQP